MKGIVSLPMPKHWYNVDAAAETGDPVDTAICADRKPYFMIYRYPELRSRYNTFRKSVKLRCEADTGYTLEETLGSENPTDEQKDFLEWYNRFVPVQHSNGVINRICRMCEEYFSDKHHRDNDVKFDPEILKVGIDYSRRTKDLILGLYHEYMDQLQSLIATSTNDDEFVLQKCMLRQDFLQKCLLVTPSEYELCDVVVDICYGKEKSKQFDWDMCGDIIIDNIVRRNGGAINWVKQTARGDITYGGKRFKMERLAVLEGFE